jgi:hypothetical protein
MESENFTVSPTFWERITDYTVLCEEIREDCRYVRLRTHSGTIAECRIPLHSGQELHTLETELAKAMAALCLPESELSHCKRVEVEK